MDYRNLVISELLFPTGEKLPDLEPVPVLKDLKQKLSKETKIRWPEAVSAILGKIKEITDVRVLDIMIPAWNKYAILHKYTDRVKYPPNETYLVPLVEHTIKSSYHPSIEILLNNVPLQKINFELSVSLMLKGLLLKIQNGKIKEITPGNCKLKGLLKCENVQVLEKESQTILFMDALILGEGITIP